MLSEEQKINNGRMIELNTVGYTVSIKMNRISALKKCIDYKI
jgi:hypothetical protein